MRRPRLHLTLVSPLLLLAAAEDLGARDLTFRERVEAQEAIERVYYSHQIGTARPFEEAVPRFLLEQKVQTYLKQSAALEMFWSTPVTADMLQQEMVRMARQTRMPERLRELYAILGDDPFLIQECLARPVLVDRLARNFFAYDRAIHDGMRREAERIRGELVAGRIDPWSERTNRTVVDLSRGDPGEAARRPGSPRRSDAGPRATPVRIPLRPEEFETWRARIPSRVGEIGRLFEDREVFSIQIPLKIAEHELRVASFSVRKMTWDDWWERVSARFDKRSVEAVATDETPLPIPMARAEREWVLEAGGVMSLGQADTPSASACETDDVWDNGSLDDFPEPRSGHTAVWTGSLMIVWGGFGNNGSPLPSGGRYDPATDTWSAVSTLNTPPSDAHTAVWTGTLMIVWGGSSWTNRGGRYDPVTDTWASTSLINAPAGRAYHTAIWTGTRMIVWGGSSSTYGYDHNTGGLYDPVTNLWTATSTVNAPSPRLAHTAVWTGSRMIVWGGRNCFGACVYFDTGGAYDPQTDSWVPTSMAGAPRGRYVHSAGWTGRHMFVWGGGDGSGYLNSGGLYDPSADTWSPTSTRDAPSSRAYHSVVWTGREILLWGGLDVHSVFGDGGRYDPEEDRWSPISATNAPAPRAGHTAVWTGTLMVAWGGRGSGLREYFGSGGRYDPATDMWTPTAVSGAPTGRSYHTAVWTGGLMVVWGGGAGFGGVLNSGGRYDPATDAWAPTATSGAPTGRVYHTAVWTGSGMVIWGGEDATAYLNTGGRYDPATDTWEPTSSVDAPEPRANHTAVWTGKFVIVWGGFDDATYFTTGGRYDPATDIWRPTNAAGSPGSRYYHTAVWTGTEMVVWGGDIYSNSGGRYDPTTDNWTSTTTTGAPIARFQQSAIWTGSLMIIWGGYYCSYGECYETETGGRYDPRADNWMPTSTRGAPSPRGEHTALWTGSRMIIWGPGRTGGRYDPATDTWLPVSTANAPSWRYAHAAVWTGGEMIVWGGQDGAFHSTGGRYCACPGSVATYYQDDDGDGYGNPHLSVMSCSQPTRYVPTAGDCNDADGTVHPGAPEICDGLDNDCDAIVDNAAVPAGIPFLAVQLSGNETLLSWSSLSQATGYDVVRGDISILISSGGDFALATQACLADDLGGTSLSVTDAHATNGGFWYLVRPVNCGGNGSYDSGGPAQVRPRDSGINAYAFSCP